jgi:hypothetical protein
MSMNIPCRKEEGYYHDLLIGVRSLPLFRSRYKSPCPPTPCDLPMFRFMRTVITLRFTNGVGHCQNAGLDSTIALIVEAFLLPRFRAGLSYP